MFYTRVNSRQTKCASCKNNKQYCSNKNAFRLDNIPYQFSDNRICFSRHVTVLSKGHAHCCRHTGKTQKYTVQKTHSGHYMTKCNPKSKNIGTFAMCDT